MMKLCRSIPPLLFCDEHNKEMGDDYFEENTKQIINAPFGRRNGGVRFAFGLLK